MLMAAWLRMCLVFASALSVAHAADSVTLLSKRYVLLIQEGENLLNSCLHLRDVR